MSMKWHWKTRSGMSPLEGLRWKRTARMTTRMTSQGEGDIDRSLMRELEAIRGRRNDNGNDNVMDLMPELLPEPEETLEGYSRLYKAKESKAVVARRQRYNRSTDPIVGTSISGDKDLRWKEDDLDDQYYSRSKESKQKKRTSVQGPLTVAVIGGSICAVSLFASYSDSHLKSTSQTQTSTVTLEHVQTEIAKGANKLFGHWKHEEVSSNKLTTIQGIFRNERLRPKAASAFIRMQRAARKDGVRLYLVSGFRSVKQQEDLYFGIKAERVQSSRERAKVSAPPGYSEHHTGYALDICDESLSLDESFAKRRAYFWLQENARAFNFELSFPENGEVAFEPWHWRYEGETEAIEAFYGRH